jgi:hypothetical protein
MNEICINMTGVTGGDYGDVLLVQVGAYFTVRAFNQGGYDCTDIDLRQLIAWLRVNRPELLEVAHE